MDEGVETRPIGRPARWGAWIVLLLLALDLSAGAQGRRREPARELTSLQPAIDEAIDRGVKYLLSRQLRDGSWGDFDSSYGSGQTALSLLALLESDLPASHPAVRRGFAYLEGTSPTKTYTVAGQLMAYAERQDPQDAKRIDRLRDLLLEWQEGGFSYPGRPGGAQADHAGFGTDLSNTQFGALGLRAATQAGAKVPSMAWESLLNATLAFQEEPVVEAVAAVEGRTSTGAREVAGFRYRIPRSSSNARPSVGPFEGLGRERRTWPATGSMTAAGLAILEICREGLGPRLRARQARTIDQAQARGLAWLEDHFSTQTNPGSEGWLFYYLYGLERVGALLGVERIGEHDWYLEGARQLVWSQRRTGAWGGGNTEPNTCFALLFLQRATAPSSGKKRVRDAVHVSNGDVRLRGTGTNPLVVWVEGFADEVLEERDGGAGGLRIVEVTYLVGDKPIVTLPGNLTRPWNGERYAHELTFERAGRHSITARVRVTVPGEISGTLAPTITLRTDGITVEVNDVLADWMLPCAQRGPKNLLTEVKVTTRSSSAASEGKAANTVDGRHSTAWIAEEGDLQPTLTLTFDEQIRANRIVLAPADSCLADRGRLDTLARAEVVINGARRHSVLFPRDPLAPAELVLRRPRAIRSLEIRLLERIPGSGDTSAVGLAEVQLTCDR